MIKQLESKINIRFASPVEPPTSEVKKKYISLDYIHSFDIYIYMITLFNVFN